MSCHILITLLITIVSLSLSPNKLESNFNCDSDCNWTRTQNHLIPKGILHHLAKLGQNGWVFVYKLSGSGFESSCSHLNFRFRACFEQGVPWNSGNYRVWIHSETRTSHDKNIQSFNCDTNLLMTMSSMLLSNKKNLAIGCLLIITFEVLRN